LCIVKTPDVVRVNKVRAVAIGQGDGDTKWKGCAWKLSILLYTFILLDVTGKFTNAWGLGGLFKHHSKLLDILRKFNIVVS